MNETHAQKLAVHVQGVNKTFGSGHTVVRALDHVNLRIAPNRLVMLVGPSGCGKTTLISIISGVLQADQGVVEVFGTRWADLTEDQRTQKRGQLVGFVFQDFNLLPTLNAMDNVAVPLLIHRIPLAEAQQRAVQMLDRVGLGERYDAMPGELSGGMQQRVAVARALVAQPRLLVCDEPTAALDGRTGQQIMELIREASRGEDEMSRCVIVVTHDARIFHFADRIEQMEDGEVLPEPSQEILEQAQRHGRS